MTEKGARAAEVARLDREQASFLERKAPDSPVQPDPRLSRESLAETDQ